jgi:hypothetical protein
MLFEKFNSKQDQLRSVSKIVVSIILINSPYGNLMFNLGHNYKNSITVTDGYRRIHSYTTVFLWKRKDGSTCE